MDLTQRKAFFPMQARENIVALRKRGSVLGSTFHLPQLTPEQISGVAWETQLKQREAKVAQLEQENALLQTENRQLTHLNRNLVERLETLESLMNGEASAKQYYFDHPCSIGFAARNASQSFVSVSQSNSPRNSVTIMPQVQP